MSPGSSRHSFIKRLNASASSAANQLDEQYRSHLCRLVEKEMNKRFKRREDPEDVVQSAFRTFYRRMAKGEFHIDTSADLWLLLETITLHKLLNHIAKQKARRRNADAEEYPEVSKFCSREPTPEEAALAADLMEKALEGLDEIAIQVFHLRLQNCTEEEIAVRLDCTRSAVRTKLNHLRHQLKYLLKMNGDQENG
jgi:RNA polymerase sigma factor (sigma-70 family)